MRISFGEEPRASRGGGRSFLSKLGGALASPFKALWKGMKSVGNALNPWNAKRTQRRQEKRWDRFWQRHDEDRQRQFDEEKALEQSNPEAYAQMMREREENLRKAEAEQELREIREMSPYDRSLDQEAKLRGHATGMPGKEGDVAYEELKYDIEYQRRNANMGAWAEEYANPMRNQRYINMLRDEKIEPPAGTSRAVMKEISRTKQEKNTLAQNQEIYEANKKGLGNKLDQLMGDAAGFVGASKVQDYFDAPIKLGEGTKYGNYTSRDEHEAERHKAEAIKRFQKAEANPTFVKPIHEELSAPSKTEQMKAAVSGFAASSKNKLLNAVDSTRMNKPAAFANFSDEDWQALDISERKKLVENLAAQDEADVEAGKSAGIINFNTKDISKIKEVPAEDDGSTMFSGGGLGGTASERRLEMQERKNANKLAGDNLRREFAIKNASREEIPEGAFEEYLSKTPFDRDWGAFKEAIGFNQAPEQSLMDKLNNKFTSFFR
jgi:hypothetical protein